MSRGQVIKDCSIIFIISKKLRRLMKGQSSDLTIIFSLENGFEAFQRYVVNTKLMRKV